MCRPSREVVVFEIEGGIRSLKCTKCCRDLPEEMFGLYKHRGKILRYRRCKDCLAEYKHNHYLKHRQEYIDRSRRWREGRHEQYISYLRDYYRKNKDELLKRARDYYLSDRGRELNRLRSRRYRQTDEGRLKERARKVVSYALSRGDLTRPDRCEMCNQEAFLEAHHPNYNRPLDVVWLCKQCHENIHHLNEGHVSWTVTALKPSIKKDA